eukprot:Tbor_TRINITY_DN5889_c1_g5::TRINITY_DN5889_c1_g5_i2::g.7305::m.7305/K07119/K07119; uncharacterized protein
MRLAACLPQVTRKLVCTVLSTDFEASTKVIETPLFQTSSTGGASIETFLKPTEILVKNHYAGINASDINYTAGIYRPGLAPPFDCGFEGLGEIVGVGASCKMNIGETVVTQHFGTFSEYQVVPARSVKVVPRIDPAILPLELSGCTAAICLGEIAKPQAGEVALVTAAAGGTGHFAVQLLKRKYNCKKVIGTCSSSEKVKFLIEECGCDYAINYKEEDLSARLKELCPTGVNLVYESVGGNMLDIALENLALKGRIITIGSISGYADSSSFSSVNPTQNMNIPTILLQKSASMRGFFLPHYAGKYSKNYFEELQYLHSGDGNNWKLISKVDDTATFHGLDSISSAVKHLHSGRNIG